MNVRNINIVLMLVAGIIVGILSIINHYSLEKLMITLVFVLIIFFLIGTLMQFIINNIIHNATKLEQNKIDEQLDQEYEVLKDKLEKKKLEEKKINENDSEKITDEEDSV